MIVSSSHTSLATRGGGSETAGKAAPPLQTIYFYLTEGCNLRCRHCWIEPPYQSGKKQYAALEPELFRHILLQAKPLGLSSVKLTGGEPLMHPRIGELLGILRDEKVRFNVETNGVLCTPALAGDLARSGIFHISVSLDGADAETHEWVRGVEGCFDAAVQGIRNLVSAGLRPQVIMTLMRRNAGEIEALIRLAESLGASSIKFNLVQPTARGVKMHQAGETLNIRELIDLGRWIENGLSGQTRLLLVYSHPMAFRPMGKMYGRTGAGCGVCGIKNITGVLADGSYAICGIGEHIKELVFGKADRDALADIWAANPVLREIREGLPGKLQGTCGDCVMRSVCLGSCIAQNYYRSRSLWASHWYCEEAQGLGLFPRTRVAMRKEHRRDAAWRASQSSAGGCREAF